MTVRIKKNAAFVIVRMRARRKPNRARACLLSNARFARFARSAARLWLELNHNHALRQRIALVTSCIVKHGVLDGLLHKDL
jgi:hypothetical protein